MGQNNNDFTNLVIALRTAISDSEKDDRKSRPEKKKQVGESIADILIAAGASREDTARALAVFGYRGRVEQLIDRFQGVYLSELMESAATGKMSRGRMTALYGEHADAWAKYTGDPSYTLESFKAAYNKWKRDTKTTLNPKGGGLTLGHRKGREKKPREPLKPQDKENG